MNTAKGEWLRIKALYQAAVEEWGWDDPRTIAMEDAEAEAFERFQFSEIVGA